MRPVIPLVVLGLTVVALVALVASAHMPQAAIRDAALARSIERLVESHSVARALEPPR
jgi:hypothetical protein